MLHKISGGHIWHDWTNCLKDLARKHVSLLWIYCPSHAGVCGNEKADKLANNAKISKQKLKLHQCDVQQLIYDKLLEKEDYTIQRLKNFGISPGDGRQCLLFGHKKRIFNQKLFGTISQHTLKHILRERTEYTWVCPECNDVVL